MILLQAAIAAGFFLAIFFIIFLMIGVPLLVGTFMRWSWRVFKKVDYLRNNMPYYKDPVLFFPCLVVSIIILCCSFYLLILLFDKLNPNWGWYT